MGDYSAFVIRCHWDLADEVGRILDGLECVREVHTNLAHYGLFFGYGKGTDSGFLQKVFIDYLPSYCQWAVFPDTGKASVNASDFEFSELPKPKKPESVGRFCNCGRMIAHTKNECTSMPKKRLEG